MTLRSTMAGPAPHCALCGADPPSGSAQCHTHLSRRRPPCGTSPLSCHLRRGTLRSLRGADIGSHVPRGPGREGKAGLCPPWAASRRPGPEPPGSGAHLSRAAPCPHAHARRAGAAPFHARGPSKPSHVAQGPSPSLGGGSSHVSLLMWCDGIFQASFQKEKVNNVKALLPLLLPPLRHAPR